ncbi:MAG: FAD-dependent oxidoreductase, partial [Planctomycetota bacterium]
MMRIAIRSWAVAVALCSQSLSAETVCQSARDIPVVREVDVLVVGGTTGAVAAATEAAGQGVSVLLVAPRTYLGEDLCATLRLWLEDDETAGGALTERIFAGQRTTTPMRVKRTLEAALIEAGVDFLLACHATDVLTDGEGRPAGIVMANRAGRQAVLAKVVIDATHRGVVARMAGAERQPRPSKEVACRRVVLGGEPTSPVEPVRRIEAGVEAAGQKVHYYEYSLKLDLGDGSFPSVAEAEQHARDLTYREGQLRAAERICSVPVDTVRGRASAGDWKPGEPWAVEHFQPRGVDRLYVLGPAADVPKTVAHMIMRPTVSESL